ncbi:MAG: peptidoglycan DD-metalloendopeptidase family protein [Nitrosomonadales bacterium]|nr:peptidoglycan DD-metalloendopeptidase family protein [Nitrosomonadales bacterium]
MRNLTAPLRRLISLALFALPPLAHALPESANVAGGVVVFPLGSVSAFADKPQAWFEERPVLVTEEKGEWFAVVGLPLDSIPVMHELKVQLGHETQLLPFDIRPKAYPEQRITLKDRSKVELSPEDLARAEREIATIMELKLHWRETAQTDLDFILPARGRLGGRFGARRYFNEEMRKPHAGLDVVVASGTPIKSSAAGVVLAVDDYFFNGKTVFVDHGNGLITMYCHLSRIGVKPGQAVRKGQRVGLAGKTGRASGPHLHWSVILNGAMVDPESFLAAERRH